MSIDTKRRRQRVAKLLAGRPTGAIVPEGAFEGAEATGAPLPHPDDIKQRVDDVIRRIPPEEIGDPAELASALTQVYQHADAGHRSLVQRRDGATLSNDQLAALEAVVEADGSRPSLLLKDGAANPDHPLSGDWRADLIATRNVVRQAAASIGRVEPINGSGSNFFGTATVVDSTNALVLTNWHVVEAMCRRATTVFEYKGKGLHRIFDGVFIDFAAETGALRPNRFKVVQAQTSNLDGPEFGRLDAAVLRIEPCEGQDLPQAVAFTSDLDGPRGGLGSMCIIGHPGRPPAGSGVEAVGSKTIDWAWVNAALFGNRYGLKRIAPGEIDIAVGSIEKALDPSHWVFGHDATTLGGSSGSAVLAWKNGGAAFGLHFAGATLRANYAHAIGACIAQLQKMGVPVSAQAPAQPTTESVARGIEGDPHSETTDFALEATELTLESTRPWRVAASLVKLRDQVNAKAPQRSKASDGTIGDAIHAARTSDHNPWVIDGGTGVVTALDITHDPSRGCDANAIAEAIIASRDPRIKYVIWNRRINSSSTSPWTWRTYAGSNQHTKHVHISVKAEKARYDDTAAWTV